jgi:hypothetical protein
MCSRAHHASTRCNAACDHRNAPQPSILDELAVLPAGLAEFADGTHVAASATVTSSRTSYIPVPPSPPPWSGSAVFAHRPVKFARA